MPMIVIVTGYYDGRDSQRFCHLCPTCEHCLGNKPLCHLKIKDRERIQGSSLINATNLGVREAHFNTNNGDH